MKKLFAILPAAFLFLTSCVAEGQVTPKNVARIAHPETMASIVAGDNDSKGIPVDILPRDGYVDMLRPNVPNKNYRPISMEVYGVGTVDVLVARDMLDDIAAMVKQNPDATFIVNKANDQFGSVFAASGFFPDGRLNPLAGGVQWKMD